jgi:hypothetical protein
LEEEHSSIESHPLPFYLIQSFKSTVLVDIINNLYEVQQPLPPPFTPKSTPLSGQISDKQLQKGWSHERGNNSTWFIQLPSFFFFISYFLFVDEIQMKRRMIFKFGVSIVVAVAVYLYYVTQNEETSIKEIKDVEEMEVIHDAPENQQQTHFDKEQQNDLKKDKRPM